MNCPQRPGKAGREMDGRTSRDDGGADAGGGDRRLPKSASAGTAEENRYDSENLVRSTGSIPLAAQNAS